jgi:dihydroxy-acid dehydratase
LRSHPVDGAVLMGGCDKTTLSLVMGDQYAIADELSAGRSNAAWQLSLGSGSDAWKFWDERRAGTISATVWVEVEAGIACSHGHCMTMGTASTMTAIAEVLSLTLPGASSIPAADSNHIRMSSAVGRRAVEMVREDLVPSKVVTAAAVNNAVAVAMATGCSTNAVVHLIAMARRAGIELTLDDLDHAGRTTPVPANIRPTGKTYLMEDFYCAGRLRALMPKHSSRLDLSALIVSGVTLEETLQGAKCYSDDVTRSLDNPVYHEGSLAVLKGNLAPTGAVIKPAACDPPVRRGLSAPVEPRATPSAARFCMARAQR